MEEERGSESVPEAYENVNIALRIGTYNILNTKGILFSIIISLLDRYDERELLLKENLYAMNADIIGLQEVVFGPR